MQRILTADSLFQEGNPSTGTKGTKVTADWLNDMQEEVCTLIEAAGIALDGAKQDQLLSALLQLAAGGVGGVKTITFADSPYNVTAADGVILADCSAGNVVVNFLSAAVASAKRITIKKIDASANAVKCTPQAAETVEGEGGSYDSVMPREFMSFAPNGASDWPRVG